jgi:hypothetical protein
MRYTEARFFNVGGIRRAAIPGSPVVLISGANGTGKTSLIDGFSLVFDGGHHPELIGPYDDKAIVEIDFDNGWKFRRTTTLKEYKLEGWSDDGVPIRKPAETLKKLISGLALNPTGLVDAPDKDRVKFLQNALPLEFTAEEIAAALGKHGQDVTLPPAPLDADGFNQYRDGYFGKRTDLNRKLRDKEGTRNTLVRSLPPEDDTDWTAKAKELHAERDRLNKTLASNTIEAQKLQNAEIDRLKTDAQTKIDAIHAALQSDIEAVKEEVKGQVAERAQPLIDQLAGIVMEAGTAEERARQQQRAAGVRDSIARVDRDAKEMSIEANRLDFVIEKLDALKKEKLNALPIPGIEIRDGRIFYNGLSFDTQLNTAAQYVLSFRVAALTLGDLQLMLFDKAESLVGETRAEFIEGIKEAGFQVIMTEAVADRPLEITAV